MRVKNFFVVFGNGLHRMFDISDRHGRQPAVLPGDDSKFLAWNTLYESLLFDMTFPDHLSRSSSLILFFEITHHKINHLLDSLQFGFFSEWA